MQGWQIRYVVKFEGWGFLRLPAIAKIHPNFVIVGREQLQH